MTKHLVNGRCLGVSQIGLERILCFDFSTKNGKLQVYFELFDKGNVVVCKGGIVLQALVHKEWKHRTIKKGVSYELPPARLNILDVKKEQFLAHFENRKGETVSSILAIDFGLGGSYAEEVCLRATIDPKMKDYDKDKVKQLYAAVQKILKERLDPHLVMEDESILDVTPFSFVKYREKKQKKLESSC